MNKKFKKIFQGGDDWQNNACININQNQHLAYSLGYKEAADFLAQNASHINRQDLFVYPIVFLYRHHLELQLKLLIEKGNSLLDRKDNYPGRHELHVLWPILKGIIWDIWGIKSDDSFALIEHIVNEFKEIDPKSMAFRYSVDLNGSNHLTDIWHINLSNLASLLNEAALELDGLYNEIVRAIDLKAEMMDYYK